MVAALLIAAGTVFAQTTAGQSFEVASVRPSVSRNVDNAGITVLDLQQPTKIGHVEYFHVSLKTMLMVAYGVGKEQISGPPWLGGEYYDIVAKLPDGAFSDQVPAMLRNLLAERFQMTVHEATRPRRGFTLRTDARGYEIKASKVDSLPKVVPQIDRILFTHCTVADFAGTLSLLMGRPIVDRTGIQGNFDITLQASRADLKAAASGGEHSSGSLSAALRTLGMRLEPGSVPAVNVVVDKAVKVPTDN